MIPPFSFNAWLAENSDKLKPPVNNHCLYTGNDFTLMVVGGPNQRNDYHSELILSLGVYIVCQLTKDLQLTKPRYHLFSIGNMGVTLLTH